MSLLLAVTATMGPTISVEDVLTSVELHHPLIEAARRDVDAARGKRLAAEGAFDLYVSGKGGGLPVGFYDGASAEVGLTQPTPYWGVELFGAYAFGQDHPIYDGKKVTSELGEISIGARVPLWRGGPTDERRTGIAVAAAAEGAAEALYQEKLIATKLKAAAVYWKWVGAHRKLEIEESMLRLAEVRAVGIESRVSKGQLAPIEEADNRRLVVGRREAVVAARRAVQARALQLSLFIRDSAGSPRVLTFASVPASLQRPGRSPPIDEATIAGVLGRRPEAVRLLREIEAVRAELVLADNDRAPAIDVVVRGSQDLGGKVSYGPDPALVTKNETELFLGVSMSLPVQQRSARGKAQAAEAKLAGLRSKQAYLADRVQVELLDARSWIDAARQRADLASETLRLTRAVEAAERRKFELGNSSILNVNLREESSAKAAKAVVDTLVDWHVAHAALRAALLRL